MLATNFFASAAVLLAAAAQVSAGGKAIIHNQCDFDVYLWSVANVASEMQTLPANGGEYTEVYRVNPNGGGVSIKMAADTKCSNITQYEYTFVDGGLWYDLSNINGYPFVEYGVTVVPDDKTCRSVACPAGTNLCAAAYNVPDDNFATAECGADTDTVVVLCSYEDTTEGSASISSVASSAIATASAASTIVAGSSVFAYTHPTASTTVVAKASSTPVYTSASHTVWHHSYGVSQPTTTTAPAVNVEQGSNPFVVFETTFVTHVITVEGRAEPTAAAAVEKRAHGHHAVHEQHVKRHSHPHAPSV